VGYGPLAHLRTGGALRRGPGGARRLALTFDDGPDPRHTPRVLDLLEARGVRATFFVVGARAARAGTLAREMAARGHELANHGWSHRSLWCLGPAATEREVVACHEWLARETGRPPRFFRPPWGMVNQAAFGILARLGTPCVLWSLQPEGLRAVAPGEIARRVVRGAHPGAIVDLHDAEGVRGAPERLLRALPPMLEGLAESGYACVPLGELLAGA
jgi:peptidoglycan/xylan/chitin deacetylase (PgdA/CDA1 family)